MDINFTKEDIAFRDEVREWLANDYPKHVKEKTDKVCPNRSSKGLN